MQSADTSQTTHSLQHQVLHMLQSRACHNVLAATNLGPQTLSIDTVLFWRQAFVHTGAAVWSGDARDPLHDPLLLFLQMFLLEASTCR